LCDLLPRRWKEKIYWKSCGGYVGRDEEYVEALNVDFAKVDMVVVVVESKMCRLRGKSGPVNHPITTLEIVPTYIVPLNYHWIFNVSTSLLNGFTLTAVIVIFLSPSSTEVATNFRAPICMAGGYKSLILT